MWSRSRKRLFRIDLRCCWPLKHFSTKTHRWRVLKQHKQWEMNRIEMGATEEQICHQGQTQLLDLLTLSNIQVASALTFADFFLSEANPSPTSVFRLYVVLHDVFLNSCRSKARNFHLCHIESLFYKKVQQILYYIWARITRVSHPECQNRIFVSSHNLVSLTSPPKVVFFIVFFQFNSIQSILCL